ncbi:MAG: 30S ribosome-binding factor RbfA [Phycisphaerales bacterium]
MSDVRNQRLATVIHRAVQGVLARGLSDPRLDECMVTITSVKISPDQRSAVLGVSIAPEKRERLALAALESASRHVRRKAGDLVSIHKMPELVFKLDRSFKRQAEVFSALQQVREEMGVEPGEPLGGEDAGEGDGVREPRGDQDGDDDGDDRERTPEG